MLGILLAGLLTVTPPTEDPARSAVAERVKAATPFWDSKDGMIIHVPTGMRFPPNVADQTFASIGIASHRGTGLDDALQYQAAGRESFTTIYVFRPTLADAGLTAAISDAVIRQRYGSATQAYDDRVVAVGTKPGVARLIRYDHATINGQQMWTGGAFMKVGGWLVSIRISGPTNKKAQLEAAMDELLWSISFSQAAPPHPFHRIEFLDCAESHNIPDARPVTTKAIDDISFAVVVAGIDAGVTEVTGGLKQQSDLTRVPDRLCRKIVPSSRGPVVELWPAPNNPGGFELTKIHRLWLVSDSGSIVEAVSASNRPQPVYLIHHDIEMGVIMGRNDRELSARQQKALLEGSLDLAQPPVGYTINAAGQISVNATNKD